MNLREHFEDVANRVAAATHSGEVSLSNYYAERSDFLRFNRSAVRQPGSIVDIELTVDLVKGRKRASTSTRLTGETNEDASRVGAVVSEARAALAAAPDDPFLLFNQSPQSSEHVAERSLPKPADVIDAITNAGNGRDMVGIY